MLFRSCAPVAARLPSARPRSKGGGNATRRAAAVAGALERGRGGGSEGVRQCAAGVVRLEAAKCECAREAGREANWLPSQLTRGCGTRARRCSRGTAQDAQRRPSGGLVGLCAAGGERRVERWCARVQNGARCAPAARGERRRPAPRSRSFQGRQKNFSASRPSKTFFLPLSCVGVRG